MNVKALITNYFTALPNYFAEGREKARACLELQHGFLVEKIVLDPDFSELANSPQYESLLENVELMFLWGFFSTHAAEHSFRKSAHDRTIGHLMDWATNYRSYSWSEAAKWAKSGEKQFNQADEVCDEIIKTGRQCYHQANKEAFAHIMIALLQRPRTEAEEAQKSVLARDLMGAARRATDIALFDHGVTTQERAIALKSLPAFDADIEAALRNEPDAWKAYQEATAYHRAGARQFGVGSLKWLMEERGIGDAEVVSFITREEYADLLPDYLQLLEPNVILNVRTALLEELSTARAREGERPLDVLQRLATSGDGSLTLLLDARQLGAIGRANIEPDAAEAVLSELGMRP